MKLSAQETMVTQMRPLIYSTLLGSLLFVGAVGAQLHQVNESTLNNAATPALATTADGRETFGPQVVSAANGGFVIVWTEDGIPGDPDTNRGVHARPFDSVLWRDELNLRHRRLDVQPPRIFSDDFESGDVTAWQP